ncbi:hypothetical protein ACWEL8_09765 [Streptomyces sp. NPDC004690]
MRSTPRSGRASPKRKITPLSHLPISSLFRGNAPHRQIRIARNADGSHLPQQAFQHRSRGPLGAVATDRVTAAEHDARRRNPDDRTAVVELQTPVAGGYTPWVCPGSAEPVQGDFGLAS